VYRERVLPADGGLGSRFGETQNPLSSLLGGVRSTVRGVPWELTSWAVFPLVALFVGAVVVRPRDPRWRVVLLGVALVAAGVLPLTFSGGVEPRLLYVAQIGMAVAVAALALIVAAAISEAATPAAHALAAALLALLLVGTLGATMTKAQDVFAEGSAKKLAADLRVYREMPREWIVPEHLADIEARLRTAGLIGS
jgi:hypothetical protein